MERIELLWDAFEDCLCKAELRAEFDRLKLRVAELAADLWDANAALDEAQSWLGTISEPITEWLKSIPPVSKSWDEHKMGYAFKAVDAIQDYLDSQKPSEKPSHGTLNTRVCKHGCVVWSCTICNPKHLCNDGIWEYIPKSECQRCNPPKCKHKNRTLGTYGIEVATRCDDCGEWTGKPLTLCPECIWGQKRREFTAVLGAYCKYVIYERCPRCRGQGVI